MISTWHVHKKHIYSIIISWCKNLSRRVWLQVLPFTSYKYMYKGYLETNECLHLTPPDVCQLLVYWNAQHDNGKISTLPVFFILKFKKMCYNWKSLQLKIRPVDKSGLWFIFRLEKIKTNINSSESVWSVQQEQHNDWKLSIELLINGGFH